MSELIGNFELNSQVFTGKVEHTDLTDIDRAVAGFFQGLVHSLTVTDTARVENQEFARFADREAKVKVFSGRVDSEEDFIRKLVAKYCGGDNARARNEILPACYVTREPSFAFTELGDYVDVKDVARLSNADGKTYATVNKSYLRMTYTLTAVAWSKPTLARLMLGVMMWLRHTKQGRQHTFEAKTMLAGAPLTSSISIEGRREGIGENGDVSLDETRLVSNRVTFDVIAEVFEAEEVTNTVVSLDLLGGGQLE